MPSNGGRRGLRKQAITNAALAAAAQPPATTMNEHLQERFTRRNPMNRHQERGRETGTTLVLNLSIRDYEKVTRLPSNSASYRHIRDVATSQELCVDGVADVNDPLEVPANRVDSPWESKEAYLESHYGLLREDAVAPLRNVVTEFRADPSIMEGDSLENAAIYEKVYFLGYTFATAGVAAKISFSLRRAQKRIVWEQSKRLVSGTMVALTPEKDMFKTVCRVGIVAARPLSGVEQNPPEIDIYFGGPDEVEIDSQQEWVMVEARNSYFEAYRHTLRALQRMEDETFPLSEHLVNLQTEIEPPEYLVEQPYKDLSRVFPFTGDELINVNILEDWPQITAPELDESQLAALNRILTKRLAIVQGPPGCGKTHVSVIALQFLLQNNPPGSPPIIVTAHTNHALDQLLRHIAHFEPNFVRLGGRTSDLDTIKPRTIYEIKKGKGDKVPGGLKGPTMGKLRNLTREMVALLQPLAEGDQPIRPKIFQDFGVITQAQQESLTKGAADWVIADDLVRVPGAVAMWLGDDLILAERRTIPEDYGFEVEEVDLEFEQLKELEAETKLDEDDESETLRGERLMFSEPWTAREPGGVKKANVQHWLRSQDMWEIPEAYRGPVYRYMQQELKEALRNRFRRLAKDYTDTALDAKIGRWEVEVNHLQKAPIIGMTTTGLSKYRGLLQSLKPKIVLVEEAAETIEAYVTAACFDSLDHLILVGDHKQLRGHCSIPELEGYPFNLDVSMFERFVQNQVGFSKMIRQRRMAPEIRKLLTPIYDELEDHDSVLGKEPVPGMGGVNSYFFHHFSPETSDAHMSKVNQSEADMIVGFFDYLVLNGMEVKDITVLTFYNGQRKLILKGLRSHPNLQGCFFKVATVDSYQGEENGVVLLSLVRSNKTNSIGFLAVENRVCVAMSRAQRGFYMFGDSHILKRNSTLWSKIIAIIDKEHRGSSTLPLVCVNHRIRTSVHLRQHFDQLHGGCKMPCLGELPCKHKCALKCHPFPHEVVVCYKRCMKTLECKHACLEFCHVSPCRCVCSKGKGPRANKADEPQHPASGPLMRPPNTKGTPEQRAPNEGPSNARPRSGGSGTANLGPPREGLATGGISSEKGSQLSSQGSANRVQGFPIRGRSSSIQGSSNTSRGVSSRGSSNRDSVNGDSSNGASYYRDSPFGSSLNSGRSTPIERISGPNQPDLSQEAQAYRDFALGGHMQADADLAAVRTEIAIQERLRQLDEETSNALFGTGGDEQKPVAPGTEEVSLVRTVSTDNGAMRGLWKGTFTPDGGSGGTGHEKPTEPSLLDM